MSAHSKRLRYAPDAVLTDLDNTLYEYASAHERALAECLQKIEHNFRIPKEEVRRAFDLSRLATHNDLRETAASHSRLLYFCRLLEMYGLGTQFTFALELEQTYWRNFLVSAQLFPDVLEFLNDLRIRKIPVVVVTNLTHQIQLRKLSYFGLGELVTAIVTSEEVGVDKPHPRIFERAMQKIGSERSRIWMIGDDPIADLRGAKATLSATTFLRVPRFSRQKILDNIDVDAAYSTFAELRSYLAATEPGYEDH